MADFLVHRHMDVGSPGQGDVVVGKIFGKAQQNTHAELVVQKTAFQVAGRRAAGAGVEAHKVPHLNAQLPGVLGGGDVLVRHDLHGVIAALGGAVLPVDMDGGIAQLAGAVVDLAGTGVDTDVFRFGIVRLHAAHRRQAETTAALDLGDHCAQGITVGFQKQAIVGIFAAKIGQNAALCGDLRRKAQRFKGILHPFGRPAGKAGGRVDGQQRGGLLPCVVRIFFVNHSFLPVKYSARHQPLPA